MKLMDWIKMGVWMAWFLLNVCIMGTFTFWVLVNI